MNKENVKNWIKEHKGLLIGTGVGVLCIAGGVIGIKLCGDKIADKITNLEIDSLGLDSDYIKKLGGMDAVRDVDKFIFSELAPMVDVAVFSPEDITINNQIGFKNGVQKTIDVIVKEVK